MGFLLLRRVACCCCLLASYYYGERGVVIIFLLSFTVFFSLTPPLLRGLPLGPGGSFWPKIRVLDRARVGERGARVSGWNRSRSRSPGFFASVTCCLLLLLVASSYYGERGVVIIVIIRLLGFYLGYWVVRLLGYWVDTVT